MLLVFAQDSQNHQETAFLVPPQHGKHLRTHSPLLQPVDQTYKRTQKCHLEWIILDLLCWKDYFIDRLQITTLKVRKMHFFGLSFKSLEQRKNRQWRSTPCTFTFRRLHLITSNTPRRTELLVDQQSPPFSPVQWPFTQCSNQGRLVTSYAVVTVQRLQDSLLTSCLQHHKCSHFNAQNFHQQKQIYINTMT